MEEQEIKQEIDRMFFKKEDLELWKDITLIRDRAIITEWIKQMNAFLKNQLNDYDDQLREQDLIPYALRALLLTCPPKDDNSFYPLPYDSTDYHRCNGNKCSECWLKYLAHLKQKDLQLEYDVANGRYNPTPPKRKEKPSP